MLQAKCAKMSWSPPECGHFRIEPLSKIAKEEASLSTIFGSRAIKDSLDPSFFLFHLLFSPILRNSHAQLLHKEADLKYLLINAVR